MKLTNRVKRRLRFLPYIKDYDLYLAIREAVFLIVEHNFPIKNAISSATHYYPTKTIIERNVRKCFPPNWFIKRARKFYLSRISTTERNKIIYEVRFQNELNREFHRMAQDIEVNPQLELFDTR